MKRAILVACELIACAAVAGIPVELKNAGFHETDGKGGAVGWSHHPNWHAEKAGHNGSGALVWECASESEIKDGGPGQEVTLKPGKRYDFSAIFEPDGVVTQRKSVHQGLTLYVEGYDANGKKMFGDMARPPAAGKSDGWIKIEGLTREIPEGVAKAYFRVIAKRCVSGRGAVDNVYLAERETVAVEGVFPHVYRRESTGGPVRFSASLNTDVHENRLVDYMALFTYMVADGRLMTVRGELASPVEAVATLDTSLFALGTNDVVCTLYLKGKEIGSASVPFAHLAKPTPRRVYIDRHLRTIVDGKPFFPFGMCYWGEVTKEGIERYAEGPFNCVNTDWSMRPEQLELCREKGLLAICGLEKGFDEPDEGKSWLTERVNAMKGNPAVMGWFVSDEQPIADIPKMRRRQEWMESLDPDHPTWFALDTVREARHYLGTADVMGLDPYPIPTKPIGLVHSTTCRGVTNTFGAMANWQFPQAFGWGWLKRRETKGQRAPTQKEMANMGWQAIAGGANGLIFYAYQHLSEPHDDPEDAFEPAWARTKAMAEEFKKYIDVFLSVDPAPTVSSSNGDVAVRTWRYNGDTYILAVNCTTNAQAATLALSENVGKLVSADFAAEPKISGRTVSLELEPVSYVMLRTRNDIASLDAAFAKIKALSDGVCSITDVSMRLKSDPKGKDPLEIWRAESKEDVSVTGAFVRVDFTLVPEKGSDVKCRVVLPLPERWDGRLWGQGNSGRAGSLPDLDGYVAMDTAAVTTDLGTTAASPKFLDKSIPWSEGVLRDFHWRATHLMTVYGKLIVKAFYGREHTHAYFNGGSTGGRQGMSEALRFPGDYDGIISVLPDNNAAVSDIALWHLWRQTHDADGKALFTKEDLVAVSEAAIAYKAKTDPKPYAGHIVADGRFTEKEIDEFIALAVERRPALAAGDRPARLKALYMPLMHKGKCYFNGFAPGTNHGVNFHWGSLLSFPHFIAGRGFPQSRWNDVGFDQIDLYLKELSPEFNACSTDLSAFVKRGGKIIMTTGWEDQTIPPAPIVDYYERVCEANGGIGNVSGFMRLFCMPGCAHGGGRGRIMTGSPGGRQLKDMLVAWCEKGVAPTKMLVKWRDGSVNMPVAPYPGLYYQDDSGEWKIEERPRGAARIDAFCLETKTTGFAAQAKPLPQCAVDLGGEWRVSGEGFAGGARLPGTLATAHLGKRWTVHDFQTTMDLPQSEALVQEWQYVGKATWTRTVELTSADCAHQMELFLERVMWASEAFWDGTSLGTCDSLATPHVYAVPRELLTPGRHELRLVIDNSCRYNFSRQSHAYGPNMQAVWNGVLGRIELRRAHPLRSARVFASAPSGGKFEVETSVDVASVEVEGLEISGWERRGGRIVVSLAEEPTYWNEFHPALYAVRLRAKDGFESRIRFGFRSVGTDGHLLTLNGVKIFTRGNVENANFAKDGVPWMDKDEWLRVFRTLKCEDGINAVRFHTWCPPRAAFEAADELGMILHPEAGIWTDKWMSDGDEVGNGKPVDGFVRREMKAIADAYGNSPSFFSLSIGNELGNSNFETMGKWVAEHKKYDPRALCYASSARKLTPADDFSLSHVVPGKGLAREKLFPHTDWDYEDIYSAATIPTVAHEIGQWPVYPIWDELLAPFTGTMRPWNLTRHRDTAAKKNALRFQEKYHVASAKLNRLIYKEEVESFLRTPSCAGLQLLEVQDYTGQAEALVGWRDPFYGLKTGFKGMRPFSSVWNPICGLARFPRFTYVAGETFRATLQIRNMLDEPLKAGSSFLCVLCGRDIVVRLPETIAPGELKTAGVVECLLTDEMTKARQTLKFHGNEWHFWVYPREGRCAAPEGVVETGDVAAMKSALGEGKTVLYSGPSFKSAKGQFKSVYWSARWFPVANTTAAALGTWFDVNHPALARFVTEDFTDWQWYSLAQGATIHALKGMPDEFLPVALSVNDFHFSDFTATMFEVLVGKGRLFVCGYDLSKDTPEAKRLRASICAYLSGAPAHGTVRMPESWLADEFDAVEQPDLSGAVYDVSTNWTGRVFKMQISGVPPTTGEVRIDFHQPKPGLTSGRGLLEGRVFEVPFTEELGAKTHVTLPVIREDFLDGSLDLEVNVMTGSALAIDRVRIVPKEE